MSHCLIQNCCLGRGIVANASLSATAEALEAESGYRLSTRAAADFQAAILGGRWSEALGLLPELGVPVPLNDDIPPIPEEPASSSSSVISEKPKPVAPGVGTASEQAKLLISQQKYLEYLESGSQKKALHTLRSELAPVAKDSEMLHTLSGFVMMSVTGMN